MLGGMGGWARSVTNDVVEEMCTKEREAIIYTAQKIVEYLLL